ncbi:MAG: hypothetical protein KC486_05380 [Myxococcales bacterium]|nr:hypothetical protein [Myxococcales bacterium]
MRWTHTPWIALVFALAACSGDDAGTDGTDSTSATTTPTTSGSTTGSATDTGTDSDSSSAGTGSDSASTSTTSETTSAGTETSGTSGGAGTLDEACSAYCDTGIACIDDRITHEECVANCLEGLTFPDGTQACADASIAYLECEAAQSCETFEDVACLDLLGAIVEVCDPVQCDGSAEEGAEVCSFQYDCTDGTVKTMSCDADGCVCFVDGVETDTCANDICSADVDLFALADKAETCCGF